MPCDIIVVNINIPPNVIAPCPTRISVEIGNIGPDPAFGRFEVCLDIHVGSLEERPVRHYSQWVNQEEGQRLPPGGVLTVVFDVQFPCAKQAWVVVTADCANSIATNMRTNPKASLLISPIGANAWLWTEVRVAL